MNNNNNTIMALTEPQYQMATLLATDFGQSGMFPSIKNKAQAMVLILVGNEIGVSALAALTGIHMIAGKPVIGANLMAERIKSSGKYDYSVLEHTSTLCKIEFTSIGAKKPLGISEFSIVEATTAGLTSNPNWKKYPKNMLFARALSNGQRWYCPDIFNGKTIYTPDEMGATVDESGEVDPIKSRNVIEANSSTVSSPSTPSHKTISEEDILKLRDQLATISESEKSEKWIVSMISAQLKESLSTIEQVPAKYSKTVFELANKLIAASAERQKKMSELHANLEAFCNIHQVNYDLEIARGWLKQRSGVESMTDLNLDQIKNLVVYVKKTIATEDVDEDFYIFYSKQSKKGNEEKTPEVEVIPANDADQEEEDPSENFQPEED